MENLAEAGVKTRPMDRDNGEAATLRSSEWRNLVADVEDLIKKVANVKDAEIAELRTRVEQTLTKAKSAATHGAANVRGYARDATRATDEYVHESPWAAVGIAAAVGAIIGFIAATRR